MTPVQAGATTGLAFGLFILTSSIALVAGLPELKLSDAAAVQTVLFQLALGAGTVAYLYKSGFDMQSLVPRPDTSGSVLGVVIGGAGFALLTGLATILDAMLPGHSAPVSAQGMSLVAIVVLSVVNAMYEEIFLLGALLRGLRGHGLQVAIGVPLLIRASYHTYQGFTGMLTVSLFGLLLSLVFIRTQRLWPVVLAHAVVDVVALSLLAA
ncbi:hypothetical protein NBRC116584_35000 [Hydrogenophaga sp. 5NK40-0174]